MRLTDIARELRITTQQLRRELTKTNFGISTTAHEVDDSLATGIIRFLKARVKPTLTHQRAAVVFKDDKEVKSEKESNGEEKEKTSEDEKKEEEKDARAKVPKPESNAGSKSSEKEPVMTVNRRIELGQSAALKVPASDKGAKPHYKSSKKGRRKKKGRSEEEEMQSLGRHPRAARKVKIARVSYDVEGDGAEIRSEEVEIMKEMDREAFQKQKRYRARSQSVGPKAQPQIKAKVGTVEIPAIISVKEFSEKCGIPVPKVIGSLLKNGIMATINQKIDFDTAAVIAEELDVKVKLKESEASSEELFERNLEKLIYEDDKKVLKRRPPVVSVMGHVDHGKTRLLDSIRKANVIATESGGITQHIGAYQVEKNGKLITFLDTPGHEAFTEMRARGARATDIAILVVAADEGVKEQTIEAIHHAQEAKIPIIVAINKMDKPNANPDKVKGELVEHGLQPEDWGGKTIMVPVSAQTGDGIDDLLEMILLVTEIEDLKANPNRKAVATVIESNLDSSMGPVATVVVNTGTLKVGDDVVVGTVQGRIKAMHDHTKAKVKEAKPSSAVMISGLDAVPHVGDILQAFKDKKTAKEKADQIRELMREREEGLSGSMAERIVSQINAGEMSFLKLVLKADTKGSLEAIMQALKKIKATEVAAKVIHFGVGNITNTDVVMAAASEALLIGFHVNIPTHISKLAEREHVDIRSYTIIYKLTEDIKALLSGMLQPEIKVTELGTLKIKEVFLDKKKWVILGCEVTKGKVTKKSMVRVVRNGETLFETELESLKHVKEDVSELEKGSDCGIRISTPKPVEVGDELEVYSIEKIKRTLDD